MNKYIQSGKDNKAPEYYDLMLRKKLKKIVTISDFIKGSKNSLFKDDSFSYSTISRIDSKVQIKSIC